MQAKKLRIGISASIMHQDPLRAIFKGKTLVYLEESLGHWLLKRGVLAYMIPTVSAAGTTLEELMADMDGLILQGGADVAPGSYGETPISPDWPGDAVRDAYEIALVKAAVDLDRPVLGICRGAQLINAAFGGTLYQDIATQCPDALTHRNWEIYDRLQHEVTIRPDSVLCRIYGGLTDGRINSVHHQAIKDVAPGFMVEATSTADGIVEAIRLEQTSDDDPYVAGVQWHPEFQLASDRDLLDPSPLLDDFLGEVARRRASRGGHRVADMTP